MTMTAPPRAGRREWIGLVVLALPTVLLSMDLTVLHLAIPSISSGLRPSGPELLWITDIYGFTLAGFLITMGTLGDRVGRRRLLLIGAVAFTAASVLASLSTSPGMLIATRALLGVAASTLMPSTLSLIRNMFLDARQRSVAIGLWMTSFMVGAMLGPPVGGLLLEWFWWGSVFLLALPVMALLLTVGPVVLPEYRNEDAGRLDLPSALLSLLAVLSVVYAVKTAASHGFTATASAALAAGIVLSVTFVRRQKRLAVPLLDIGLFRNRTFATALTAMTVCSLVMMGSNLFVAQYLQLVHGLSPLKAGLWMIPSTLASITAVMVVQRLVQHFRPALLMSVSFVIAALGFVVITRVEDSDSLGTVLAGTCIFAFGLAAPGVLSADILVSSGPPERAGEVSAIQETSTELGGAFGLAVLGSVFNAAYRADVADTVPAGTPDTAASAARDTLGGAVDAVSRQPDRPWSEDLLDAARSAFVDAFHTTALVSIAVVLLTAALVASVLRRSDGQKTAH
ncbi:Multidrug efflux pump LfrA [Streptomyces sp. enrichment culture]|uniref:MFS transporter n=1 Tax=Streptomyces sp. enrichment culture TaxID=1795815 RepID=UPI003F578E53